MSDLVTRAQRLVAILQGNMPATAQLLQELVAVVDVESDFKTWYGATSRDNTSLYDAFQAGHALGSKTGEK